jgi:hypothetical protein
MPHSRFAWHERIKAAEREYWVIRLAVERLLRAVRHDPTILGDGMRHGRIQDAWQHLEGTYLVRLFSEFESGLRSYWATIKKTRPQSEAQLNGVAARRDMPHAELTDAHAVRRYRNHLVHEREERAAVVPIATARRYLARYFSRLPETW